MTMKKWLQKLLNYDMTFMTAITLDKYNRDTSCYLNELTS